MWEEGVEGGRRARKVRCGVATLSILGSVCSRKRRSCLLEVPCPPEPTPCVNSRTHVPAIKRQEASR